MKFLIDECVGVGVAEWLIQQNFDVNSIAEECSGYSDDMVLNKAVSENRVLITADKDFGEMIFRLGKHHCGLVLIRLVNQRPANKIAALKIVLENHKQDMTKHFLVASEAFVRVIKQSPE